MEIWKKIIDFDDYEISSFGRVRNIKTKTFKKPSFNKLHNYWYVVLWKNNKPKHAKIYRLQSIHFIENNDNKPQVNHIDGNRCNHDLLNYEWTTQSENQKHAFENGLSGGQFKKGFQHQHKKLNPCDMLYIYAHRINKQKSLKELANMFNCTRDHVCRISNKKYYELVRAKF